MYDAIVAFDYETANANRSSACAVAAVKMSLPDGRILDQYETLIDPEEWFDSFNIMIHGIKPEDVEGKPTFPDAMLPVYAMLDDHTMLVAHNTGFDVSVMKYAAEKYGAQVPDFTYGCTYRLARNLTADAPLLSYTLPDVADAFGIEGLDHHVAASDALICGKIFLHMLAGYPDVETMFAAAQLRIGVHEGDTYSGIHVVHRYQPKQKGEADLSQLPAFTTGPDSVFYKKTVCFTGKLMSMTREQAEAIITEIGGKPVGSVGKKLDYLVTGYQRPEVLKGKSMSTKKRAALALLESGYPVQVLPEDQFLQML